MTPLGDDRRLGGHSGGPNTRSHPELGRETLQRQWYFGLSRGRVGRRQVFNHSRHKASHTPNASQSYTLERQIRTYLQGQPARGVERRKPRQGNILGYRAVLSATTPQKAKKTLQDMKQTRGGAAR